MTQRPATRGWTGVKRGVVVAARVVRRALAESLYLLTGPIFAAVTLLLTVYGLMIAGVFGASRKSTPRLQSGRSPGRWAGDLEWWRLTSLRRASGLTPVNEKRSRATETAGTLAVGAGLDAVYAAVAVPLALLTSIVTALWWFVGVGGGTSALRGAVESPEVLRPLTLNAGDAQSHVYLSLGLTSPAGRLAFGTVIGVLLLLTLPVVTRACVAVHSRLGRSLLSDASPFFRRIHGLEAERDDARAQKASAMSAEVSALRRLERDIHDGPQQRLVRLGMELGRVEHHLAGSPDVAKQALADAIVQTHEALNELRALSRGIAPPILVDRGLREALEDLATRSTIPVHLDVEGVDHPVAATETAAYFVVSEALTNVAKHSRAQRCEIGLRRRGGTLTTWVTDDGVGGAALQKGHGLRGLDDRVRAVGGLLVVTSPEGGPTTVLAEMPWD